MGSMRSLIVFLLVALFLGACGERKPTSPSQADHIPREDWIGTFFYGSGLSRHAEIALKEDGTFEAGIGDCYSGWTSFRGTWTDEGRRIDFVQKSVDGELDFFDLAIVYKVAREDDLLLIPRNLNPGFYREGANAFSCFRKGSAYPNWSGDRMPEIEDPSAKSK